MKEAISDKEFLDFTKKVFSNPNRSESRSMIHGDGAFLKGMCKEIGEERFKEWIVKQEGMTTDLAGVKFIKSLNIK